MRKLILSVVLVAPLLLGAASGGILTAQFSHSNQDDPIVFPNQPGASHKHCFFAARNVNAFTTTPQQIRANGTSAVVAGETNAYWIMCPEVNGQPTTFATAKNALFYWRKKQGSFGTGVVHQPPDGLRWVIGNSHATSVASNTDLTGDSRLGFRCGTGGGTFGTQPVSPCSAGIEVLHAVNPNCVAVDAGGAPLLDSPNHRSHMAYPSGSRCPASHPYAIWRQEAFYRIKVPTSGTFSLTFSSGPYYTVHADTFIAMEPSYASRFQTRCIDANIDCGTNPALV